MKGYGLMFAQSAADSAGMWGPVVGFLEGLLIAAATLGIIVGALMIAASPTDEEKRVTGITTIGGSAMGLAIGLLAVPLYNLIDGWM